MNRWPFNRGETLALVAIVIALVGQIPDWVGLGEKLGFEPAQLAAYAESVQRVLAVVVVSAAVLIVVSLIWRLRGQVVRPFKWLGGLGKRFYLWVLRRLVVGPAREHFGVQLAEAGRGEKPSEREGDTPPSKELVPAVVWGLLSCDSLRILQVLVTRGFTKGPKHASLVWPEDYSLEPPARGVREARDRLGAAAQELARSEIVTRDWRLEIYADSEKSKLTVRFANEGPGALHQLFRDVDKEVLNRRRKGRVP